NAAALRTAMQERDRLDAELARRSADYGRLRESIATTCRALAGSLPEGTDLVSYVRYGDWSPRDSTGGAFRRPSAYPYRVPSYVAFVMHAGDSSVVGIPLGRASTTDSLVAGWRHAVLAPAQPSGERAARQWGSSLRARVWDPVAAALHSPRQAFVVPDGALSLVSIAALPDSSGYVVERGPLIHYLGAEREVI